MSEEEEEGGAPSMIPITPNTVPATGRAEDPMGSVSPPSSPQFIYLDLSLLRFLQ